MISSHSGANEDSSLLGYDILTSKQFQHFKRVHSLHFLGPWNPNKWISPSPNNRGNKLLQNVGNFLPIGMA